MSQALHTWAADCVYVNLWWAPWESGQLAACTHNGTQLRGLPYRNALCFTRGVMKQQHGHRLCPYAGVCSGAVIPTVISRHGECGDVLGPLSLSHRSDTC